jgi:RND superfamily putative drug exporter
MPSVRARRRWFALGLFVLWLLVAGFAGPLSGRLTEVEKNDNAAFLPKTAESTAVNDLQQRFVDQDTTPGILVWERESGLTAADRALATRQLAEVRAVPKVVAVTPLIPSQDGKALQSVVQLAGTDGTELTDAANAVRDKVQGGDGLAAYVTGPAGLLADFIAAFEGIDSTLLLVTGVVVIVILLLVYRSPVLRIFPLLSVSFGYSLAGGLVYLLAKDDVLTLNGQSQGILTVLVFGAGTDYALLIISRFREELRRHEDKYDAMRAALRGAGPAVLASGITVILGLLCLLFSDLSSNKSLGPVAALGIAATMAAMLTLLPALLALVGRRAFWPFVPRYGSEAIEARGFWSRAARFVGRHARAVAVVVVLVLVGLSLGIGQLRVSGISQSESFTTTQESVTGQQALERHFPAGVGSPAVIIARDAAADQVLSVVKQTPGVSNAAFLPAGGGEPSGSAAPRVEGGLVEIDATLASAPDSPAAYDTVTQLRSVVHAIPGADAKVGGFSAINLDVSDASKRDRVVIIPIVLAVILVVLAVLLRALVAPLLLIATVVLSFAATLGVCAVVFNHVFHFAGADTAFPLFAFVFLVALGIDYNIFLMTRVREETLHIGTRPGVLRGLAVTGGVITSAGVVLAATFSVLGVLPLVFLAEIGFAVAFGVLLDTIVVRSLLVPALVYEVGRRVWWPSRLARRDEGNRRRSRPRSGSRRPRRSAAWVR